MVFEQGLTDVEFGEDGMMDTELLGEVISLKSEVEHLREWQQRQNGSLLRLERRVEQIYFWLIGLMGGVIASLVLLVVNIALNK